MTKTKLLLVFLLGASCITFSQITDNLFNKTITYKLSNDIVEDFLFKKNFSKKEFLSVLNISDTTTISEDSLRPTGHYATISQVENNYRIEYYNQSNVILKLIQNKDQVLCIVRDFYGLFVQNGTFFLGNKKYNYSSQYDAYVIPMNDFKQKSRLVFKYKGHSTLYKVTKSKNGKKIKNYFQFKKYYYLDESNHSWSNKRSFVILSQKILKHGDTLRFKIYMAQKNHKPFKEGIQVYVRENYGAKIGDVSIIKKVDNHYEGFYVCNDSLKSGKYELIMKEINHKKHYIHGRSEEFEIQNYEPQKYSYKLSVQRFGNTDSIAINHHITDVNNRPLNNYLLKINVHINRLDTFFTQKINHVLLDTQIVASSNQFSFSNPSLSNFEGSISVDLEFITPDGFIESKVTTLYISNGFTKPTFFSLDHIINNKFLFEGPSGLQTIKLYDSYHGTLLDEKQCKNGDTLFVTPLASYYNLSYEPWRTRKIFRPHHITTDISYDYQSDKYDIKMKGNNKYHLAILARDSIYYSKLDTNSNLEIPLTEHPINFHVSSTSNNNLLSSKKKKDLFHLQMEVDTELEVSPNDKEQICVTIKDVENNPLKDVVVDFKMVNSQLPEKQKVKFESTQKFRKEKSGDKYVKFKELASWQKKIKQKDAITPLLYDSTNCIKEFLDSEQGHELISVDWKGNQTVIQPIVLNGFEKEHIQYIIINGDVHFWDQIQPQNRNFVLGVKDSASIYIRTDKDLHVFKNLKLENKKINYLLINQQKHKAKNRSKILKFKEFKLLDRKTTSIQDNRLSYIKCGSYVFTSKSSNSISFPKSSPFYICYDLDGNVFTPNHTDKRFDSREKTNSLDTAKYKQKIPSIKKSLYDVYLDLLPNSKYYYPPSISTISLSKKADFVIVKNLDKNLLLKSKIFAEEIPKLPVGNYRLYAFNRSKNQYFTDSLDLKVENEFTSYKIIFNFKQIEEKRLDDALKHLNTLSAYTETEAVFNIAEGILWLRYEHSFLYSYGHAVIVNDSDTLKLTNFSMYGRNKYKKYSNYWNNIIVGEKVYSYNHYRHTLTEINDYTSYDPFHYDTRRRNFHGKYRSFKYKVKRTLGLTQPDYARTRFSYEDDYAFHAEPRFPLKKQRYGKIMGGITSKGTGNPTSTVPSSASTITGLAYNEDSTVDFALYEEGSRTVLGSFEEDLLENKELTPRNSFKDQALFSTTLLTDSSGKVCTQVSYPSDITTWKLSIYALADKGRFVKTNLNINSSLKQSIESTTPSYLIEGDSLQIPLFLYNQETTELNATVDFKAGKHNQNKAITVKDSKIIYFDLKAEEGMNNINSYATFSNDHVDGESRPLKVLSKDLVRIHRIAHISNQDTSLSLPKGATITEIGTINHLLHTLAKQFEDYRYHCSEQDASLLLLESIRTKKANHKLVQRVLKHRNKDGLWGWRTNSGTNQYVSYHVINCLEAYDSLFDRSIVKHRVLRQLTITLRRNLGYNPLLWLKAYELGWRDEIIKEHLLKVNKTTLSKFSLVEQTAHFKLCSLLNIALPKVYGVSNRFISWDNKWLQQSINNEEMNLLEVSSYIKEHRFFTTYSAAQIAYLSVQNGIHPFNYIQKNQETRTLKQDEKVIIEQTETPSLYLITYKDTITSPLYKATPNLSISTQISDSIKFGAQESFSVEIKNTQNRSYLMAVINLPAGLILKTPSGRLENNYYIDPRENKIYLYLENFNSGSINIPVKTKFRGSFTHKASFIFDMYGNNEFANDMNQTVVVH